MPEEKNINQLADSNDWNRYWQGSLDKENSKISRSKQRIIKTIGPYFKKNKKILDAGCGSGFFSKYFCDVGLKTVALDFSKEALESAKKISQGRAQILEKDLMSESLAIEIGSDYDYIFTDGLFEHFSLESQNKIFHNFYKVLKKDGIALTFVPNKWSPWQIIRPFYMPGIKEKPFILKDLIELNYNNGFEILETGGINTLPFSFSPDKIFGPNFGMLLYSIARKK